MVKWATSSVLKQLLECMTSTNGDADALNDLLSTVEVDINAYDSSGFTLMHHAASLGYDDCIYALFKAGANLEQYTIDNRNTETVAMEAGFSNTANFIKSLGEEEQSFLNAIANDDINYIIAHAKNPDCKYYRTNSGLFPLHFACQLGVNDIVLELLNANYDINQQDIYGRTPLHWAALVLDLPLFLLLSEKGAKCNIRSYSGKTPITMAFPFLKEYTHPDFSALCDEAFFDSIRHLDLEACESYIENRSPDYLMQLTTEEGNSPLHVAVHDTGSTNMNDLFLQLTMIRLFLSHNFSIEAVNKQGQSVLDVARLNSHSQVYSLIESKFPLSSRSRRTSIDYTQFPQTIQSHMQEVSQSGQLDQSNQSNQSIQSTLPTQSVQPTLPTLPTQPVQPTQSVQPTLPILQTQPVQPTQSVQPTQPVQPTQSVQPTLPTQLTGIPSTITKEPIFVMENFSDNSGNIKEEVQKQISNENKPDSTLKPNSPISALLEENGLQEYQSVFDSAGYHICSDLFSIEEQTLKDMGIKMGHRRCIFEEIQRLKTISSVIDKASVLDILSDFLEKAGLSDHLNSLGELGFLTEWSILGVKEEFATQMGLSEEEMKRWLEEQKKMTIPELPVVDKNDKCEPILNLIFDEEETKRIVEQAALNDVNTLLKIKMSEQDELKIRFGEIVGLCYISERLKQKS